MRDFTKQSQTTMDNVDASVSAFDRGGFFNPHRARADTVETRKQARLQGDLGKLSPS